VFFTPGFGVGVGLADLVLIVFFTAIPFIVCLISVAVGYFSSFPLSMAEIRHCPLDNPTTVIEYLPVARLKVAATLQTAGVCEITFRPSARSGSLIAAEFTCSKSPNVNLKGPVPVNVGTFDTTTLVSNFSTTGSIIGSSGLVSRVCVVNSAGAI